MLAPLTRVRLAVDALFGLWALPPEKERLGGFPFCRGGELGGMGGGTNCCCRDCVTPGLAIARPDDAIALAKPVGLRFLFEPERHGLLLLAEAMEAVSESAMLGGSERPDFALTELRAGDRTAASISGAAKLAVVGVLSSFADSGESTSSIDRVRGGTSTTWEAGGAD